MVAALAAAWLLRKRPWSARFAAALLALLAGTPVVTTLLIAVTSLLSHHRVTEIPIRFTLLILATASALALYNILTIAARLMLPVGLPLTVLLALLIARRPR